MSIQLPEEVLIVEVGPRDGLQNIDRYVETDKKVKLINALSSTGLKLIEVTSFVHPKAVPQLRDAREVMERITRREGIVYRVLVPNLVGAERAVEIGVQHINFVVAASETFNKNNVRRSVKESMAEFEQIIDFIKDKNVQTVTASIATAFGCPFEKKVLRERVIGLIRRFTALGIYEVILCDTTGMANPLSVKRLLQEVLDGNFGVKIAVHFHNTRGTGLANIITALTMGVSRIETCIGGLGGCPFAPGANANVATEDTVNMLQDMDVDTGIDLDKLVACAKLTQELVGKKLPGQVMKSGPTYA
jgi:hydroxymethylglutaryl-CoA lyase